MAVELLNRLATRAASKWRMGRDGDDAMTIAGRRQMLVERYHAIISIPSARRMAHIVTEGAPTTYVPPG